MYTVEFETDAKERMIEIPEVFATLASKHLKVVLSYDENQNSAPSKSVKRVSALSLNTINFKFDREEANKR